MWLAVAAAGGLRDALHVMGQMRAWLIALAVGSIVLRFVLLAAQMRRVIGRGELGVGVAWALALVVFGLGAVTPAAPAEGLALATHELRRRAVPTRLALLMLAVLEWFTQRIFLVVGAADLALVLAVRHLTRQERWTSASLLVAAAVLLAVTGLVVNNPRTVEFAVRVTASIRLRQRRVDGIDDRIAAHEWRSLVRSIVGNRRNRLWLGALSAGAVLADAGALWFTCHAAGLRIQLDIALLGAVAGNVATWVPLLPSGLGLVEVAIPAILHRFGASLDGALAATLVYRGLGTLAPSLFGLGSLIALRSRRIEPTDQDG